MGQHTSYKRITYYAYPTDSVMPTTHVVSNGTVLPGLISASHTGPAHTKIDDTEQYSPGGAKQSFPGRPEAVDFNAKFTWSRANYAACALAAPGPLATRVHPANGRRIFELERVDGVKLRTFGYLDFGQGGDGEDDKDVFDVTIVGSGELFIVVPPPPA
jgi:hypothetical protein